MILENLASLTPMTTGKAQAAQVAGEVFFGRDDFHVVGIDARRVATQMIDLHTLRDWPVFLRVVIAIGAPKFARLCFFVPYAKLRSIRVLKRPLPNPAARFRLNDPHDSRENLVVMTLNILRWMSLHTTVLRGCLSSNSRFLAASTHAQSARIRRNRWDHASSFMPSFPAVAHFFPFFGESPNFMATIIAQEG